MKQKKPKKHAGTATTTKTKTVRIPQQTRSRKTRNAIIEAATECFEENGYDATTTAQIAATSGIAVGTLYGYFRNKREILIELVDLVVLPMDELTISELLSESSDPTKLVHEIVNMVFSNQALRPGIQQVLLERYLKDDELRHKLEALRDQMRHTLELFFRSLEKRGLLRDIDHKTASFVILHAVQWNATQTYMHLKTRQSKAAMAATADMVSRYLLND